MGGKWGGAGEMQQSLSGEAKNNDNDNASSSDIRVLAFDASPPSRRGPPLLSTAHATPARTLTSWTSALRTDAARRNAERMFSEFGGGGGDLVAGVFGCRSSLALLLLPGVRFALLRWGGGGGETMRRSWWTSSTAGERWHDNASTGF